MSLPPEILKKVKLLEISTRKLVNNIFAGEYHSAFKGQGMTFSEFREYVPGDDVRTISWPLTARAGKPFIKKYDEEREMTLMLVVDVSGSEDFGSKNMLKGEVISHLAALLSFSAVKNNDAIGLLLFSDQVEHFVPPKKGRGQVQRILRDLYYFKPKSHRTNISTALEYLHGVLRKRANVFIFSDFYDQNFDGPLRLIGRRHDTVAIMIEDEVEVEIPKMGLVDFQDPETGEVITVDTSSPGFQRDYRQLLKSDREQKLSELKRSRVDLVEVKVNDDFVDPLINYFKRRNRR